MAARYVRIGQYPDYRDEIRGNLLEILASTANPGTYAAPEGVAGCTLEMGDDGLWTGFCGSVGALPTSTNLGDSTADINSSGTLTHWDHTVASGWVRRSVTTAAVPDYYATYSALTATYPNGGALGQIVWLPNPAVPLGRSRLQWNGTAWVPPAGEPIILINPQLNGSAIVDITPGVTTLLQIWASNVIPDYMIPDGLNMSIEGNIGAMNSVSQTNTVLLGFALSGSVPTAIAYGAYIPASNQTPNAAFPKGLGSGIYYQRLISRYNDAFRGPDPVYGDGSVSLSGVTTGYAVSNSIRLYAMANPGHISDRILFYRAAVYSKGNL